jgi:hypothetical protein
MSFQEGDSPPRYCRKCVEGTAAGEIPYATCTSGIPIHNFLTLRCRTVPRGGFADVQDDLPTEESQFRWNSFVPVPRGARRIGLSMMAV